MPAARVRRESHTMPSVFSFAVLPVTRGAARVLLIGMVAGPLAACAPTSSGVQRAQRAAAVEKARARSEARVPAAGVRELDVENEAGEVIVSTSDDGRVFARTSSQAEGGGDEKGRLALASQVRVRVAVGKGGRAEVRVTRPSPLPARVRLEVRLEVYAPATVNVSARGTRTALTAQGLKGDVKLDTQQGDLVASDCGGKLDLHTDVGTVTVSTHHGGKQPVRIRLGTGELTFQGTVTALDVESGDAPMDIVLENVPRSTRLASTGGDIDVVIPHYRGLGKPANVELKAHSDLGQIDPYDLFELDLPRPVGKLPVWRDWTRRLGTGVNKLEATTNGGRITFRMPG